jgi:xanthine dehydrogenase small subunit
MVKINFVLNGDAVEVNVEKGEMLLFTLRERLKLKSVKEGCGIGECGACTVLINDRPIYSCITPTTKVQGKEVKTVEFLGTPDNLHPLQENFVKMGAVQCGYCTPGMLLASYALLIKNPKPTEKEIREAISGNLCRCTGYLPIIEAIKSSIPHFLKIQFNQNPVEESSVTLSKDEILEKLCQEKVEIIAGGTDILVSKRKKDEKIEEFLDLTTVKELRGIKLREDRITIGSVTTHAEIQDNILLKNSVASLSIACSLIGSPQIRNMATIGGNIINASPAADSIPPLLIHDAVCILESKKEKREIPLMEFIIGPYKTVKKKEEILTEIRVSPLYGYREGYVKVGKRKALAISRLSIAFAIKEDGGVYEDVRISIGSCTPVPFRAYVAEDILKGNKKDERIIQRAIEATIREIINKSGGRSSYVYKLPVVRDLLKEILEGKRCQ